MTLGEHDDTWLAWVKWTRGQVALMVSDDGLGPGAMCW